MDVFLCMTWLKRWARTLLCENLNALESEVDYGVVKTWNKCSNMIKISSILRKIPNLSGAINLELLDCSLCKSLVELPCLNHLASLHHDRLYLQGCYRLKNFPQVPRHFCSLGLLITELEEVPHSIEHLHKLQRLSLSKSKDLNMSGSAVKNVSIKLESLHKLNLSDCPMIKFPEIPRSLIELNLSGTQIEEVSLPFDSLCNLQILNMSGSAVKNISIRLESLRKLDLSGCPVVQFPNVPRSLTHLELSRTQIEEVSFPFDPLCNLEYLKVRGSTVKNVSIKLESIRRLDISGCPMVEFLKVPRGLIWLKLSNTQIEEAAMSIDTLSNLKELKMSSSSIPKLQCNISLFDLREFPTVDVPSPSLRSKTLRYMWMDRCKSLKLLSELPPYLQGLSVHDCTSLEKVSFADQSLYQFDSLVDDDNYNVFCMLFCNCFNLNQESTNNIEAKALLKVGSLAMKWAARYGRKKRRDNCRSLICCFPGNNISGNKFKCQSMNSSLSLKIVPNWGSGSRFLVFSICIVADLTHCRSISYVGCICEYQLTATDGGYEKFEK
ncbi:hypothetical protein GOBAR_AA39370 [Gossypium barbadense]|uniref:Uncharacterized protein n=1 Tax=Gossypium barbadense TaxID=3634 RepID=A0A2P5VR77_GOSBA|nr:hypothetical protein GOBAR_AA39370 [Gossypium barbadense]